MNVDFWRIDSWDSECFYYTVGSTEYPYGCFTFNGGNLCGGSWGEEAFSLNSGYIAHTSSSIYFSFRSTIDQDPWDESWGLRNFYLYYRVCDNSCQTCNGVASNNCLTCWPDKYV